MKSLKKSLVTLLACTMAIAPCMVGNMPVSAAEGDYTISVKASDELEHTYNAYQIFTGTLYTNPETNAVSLLGIQWGDDVNGAALLDELKQKDSDTFNGCKTAEDVAKKLDGQTNDSDIAVLFATAAEKHLKTDATVDTGVANTETTANDYVITIPNDKAGYYLVKDEDGSLSGTTVSGTTVDQFSYTRALLKLVETKAVEVNAKAVLPTRDKDIVEATGDVKANTASIGDNVKFKLESNVPDMTGYNQYYFVINDTLTTGLSYVIGEAEYPFTVKINGTEIGSDQYRVDYNGKSFELVFRNFIQYNTEELVGKPIEITYYAQLNTQANLTDTGNKNTAKLTYSNNPNFEYSGETTENPWPTEQDNPATPDDDNPYTPDPDEPSDDTPEITTVTYATTLQIIKVDGDDNNKTLKGAKFKLEKLVGETYVPVGEVITTGDDGLATFAGLGEGTYRITETQAPENYNGLTGTIVVTLDATATVTSIVWTDDHDEMKFENNTFKITVENNKGSSLPTTGGMGTTLIYVLGGMLVLCSIVLIITRKRMEYRQF